MEPTQLNWIANFIWGIADDVLRDLYVRGTYRTRLIADAITASSACATRQRACPSNPTIPNRWTRPGPWRTAT